ncbi:MAG: OPT/YSL family transporter [Candidatus Hodarchaeota archaeon]
MTDTKDPGKGIGANEIQSELQCETDATPPQRISSRVITFRGISLAIILNMVYTVINAYLGINFGFGLGFGILTVLTAYTLFHVGRGGSNRQEITTTMIASTGFVVYYTLTIAMYIQAYTAFTLPWWLAPPKDVLLYGTPFDPSWLPPILFHISVILLGTFLGFITALAVVDYVHSRPKTSFPFYLASGVTINTCMQAGQQSRFMFRWLAIGIVVTVLQYFINALVAPFGFSAINWDFTPFLPLGFALGFILNISLLAVSFIIDPKVSISMLFAGIITYLVIAPILVSLGVVTPALTGQDFYFNLLFQYTFSPALGIMLISGLIVFAINRLRKRRNAKEASETLEQSVKPEEGSVVGFGDYIKIYFKGLFANRLLGPLYLLIMVIFIVLVSALNVFSLYPLWVGILISIVLLLPVAIIDTFVLIKFVGEAGLGMGVQRLAFYEIPLTMVGFRGYVPFMAYPVINPFQTTDALGNMKIGVMTETPRRAILIAQLVKTFPGIITSVAFVLAAWYLVGFPTVTFPAVGVIQGFAIVSLFANQAIGVGFDFTSFFIYGGVVGLLAALFPVSSLGVALAMFLPPSYFIPFSIGGFLRLYAQKKYSTEWFAKRGQVIAVGFIAGSAISQVIASFLAPSLQLWILPIWLAILVILLWRYRHDPSSGSSSDSDTTEGQKGEESRN